VSGDQAGRRDYGPRQLADYLGAPYGRVDNARYFGLLPEPDRARGRLVGRRS
jgi:hypothetical protein